MQNFNKVKRQKMTLLRLKEEEEYPFFFLVSSHCPCPPKDSEVHPSPPSLYRLGAGTRNVQCPVPGGPAGLGRTGTVLSLGCLQGPRSPRGKLTRSRHHLPLCSEWWSHMRNSLFQCVILTSPLKRRKKHFTRQI